MYRQTKLPRWRGFNLDGSHRKDGHYREDDFRDVADLGFDFVRIPLAYTEWIQWRDPFDIDESRLAFVDEAVLFGERQGLHVSLNFHRGPGFCVSGIEQEPFRLFEDATALACFAQHWEVFARRYRGQSSKHVSFNLLNEPRWVAPREHAEVMRTTVRRIRAIDPDRLILLDGLNTGNDFPTDLVDLGAQGVGFCTRGYVPLALTHHLATWGHHPQFEIDPPAWPNGRNRISSTEYSDGLWDRDRLEGKYRAWAAIAEATGTGVMCGECGVWRRTPHGVALAWMEDLMDILQSMNIGFALWNFRGGFGILDSGREDVDYEDWRGHRLDRRMLDLLQRH